MKIYLSEREARTLALALGNRDDYLRARAKKEGWRQSELAMALADLDEVKDKISKPMAIRKGKVRK